jgi:hypothetical protein
VVNCKHTILMSGGSCYFCGEVQSECEYYGNVCECEGEIEPRVAHTAYEWDGRGEDPNRDRMLCDAHAEVDVEYWGEMWADYYSGGVRY